jgi:hypothetical protein
MKKPPKPKNKRQKDLRSPTPLGAPKILDSNKTGIEPKSLHKPHMEKERRPPPLWWVWKEFWAFAGPIISVVGLYFLLRPQITVEPSVNLDPAQTLSTQLLIKNSGHVPVYNIHFGFALGGGSVSLGSMTFGPKTLEPVAALPAGVSVTRELAAESFDVKAPDVILKVSYRWPIIGKETTESFHFSIKRGTAGFFLVPDLQP